LFFYEQEIWWCSLGVNIGSEIDGKNDFFERPVLIVRKITQDLILVAPITSKTNDSRFRIDITSTGKISQITLIHCRIISSQRLLRKIGYVKKNIFQKVLLDLIRLILGQ
jgi:mRNA interferase MazF